MRPEQRRSFLDSAALRDAWSSPSLKNIPLSADELSHIRSADNPAAALREIFVGKRTRAASAQ